MYSKTLLVALLFNSLVVAAPVPNDQPSTNTEPSKWSWTKTIQDIAGSPFGNGVDNGNGNSAGNGNKGNGNNNFGGNGNNNGNGNSFGNGNGFFSGNQGIGIGRRTDWSKQSNGQPWGSSSSTSKPAWSISNVAGSPFGNGNGNGNGNIAGSGNSDNGNGNFGNNGNGNGNENEFGNGNSFFSGNQGLGIGKKVKTIRSLGSYIASLGKNTGTLVDGATLPLMPGSSNPIIGSPYNNGNLNGGGNSAGNHNTDNGSGTNNGNNNGNGNTIGNGNNVLSGNCGICSGPISVRREASAASIPPGTFYLVPPQLADSLNQDFSQLFTVVIPQTGPAVIKGALTGKYPGTKREEVEKRQVLTGLENIIAQAVSDEAPPNRSGFFGINIK